MMRWMTVLCCLGLAIASGCVPQNIGQTEELRSLPVISGAELERYVAESDLPVLVEFGVDFQCERCRQMRSPVVELSDKFNGRANVVRVDFNTNAGLAAQFGGSICPSYVFFEHGEAVRTESFPVSADILESHLHAMSE